MCASYGSENGDQTPSMIEGGERREREGGREGGREGNESYLDDGIAFANVSQEFVAQPFALRGSLDQPRDVHELQHGRQD